jgi:exonuclease SbcD
MKILHTSDWHVGKSLRGNTRFDEHRAVLNEIAGIARHEAVDVVLVVGDLFESAAPSPEAQAVVWQALLDLRATGAQVIVLAGNHDNPYAFEAIRPLFKALGVVVLGHACAPDQGGLVELTVAGGEHLRIALLPFCSQRYVIRAAQLMGQDAAENAGTYAERVAVMIAALAAGFSDDAVNVFATHCMVRGGKLGGGERDAQTVFDYFVDATAFPARAHYVALGHLHRTQALPGGCPIWYCGSPVQVDFGEEEDDKHVLIVEATPSTPATVRQLRLTSPRRLRTLRGTMTELEALAGTTGEAFLRVFVREPARVGLADEVRELFPLAVDVRIEPEKSGQPNGDRQVTAHRTSTELFGEFLGQHGIADERLERMFAQLLDEATLSAREV